MKVAVCVIISVLCGFGCGSEPANTSNATGNAGTTSSAGGAGSKAVTPVAGTAATAGTTAPVTPPATGGRRGPAPAAGSSSPAPTTTAGRTGGSAGTSTGPSAAAGSTAPAPAAGSGGAGSSAPATTEKFSFFVTSLDGMKTLSKNDQGFGGDLRFGETTGLAGADKICTTLAEKSMPGAGAKGWRAFLSTAKGGESGGPSHARDRVGQGPWYDRNGRLVAMTLDDLIQQRPRGANSAIINDLPNENGVPNHLDTMMGADDNHDTVTGSNAMGQYDGTPTCNDWTTIETAGAAGSGGTMTGGGRGMMGRSNGPRIGHSWPAQSGMHWIAAHQAPGCSPSVALVQMGGGSGTGIGNGGGYGGFYCFALKP